MKGKNPEKKSGTEKLIEFRPSPNFKNMKKFLKHRSDTETSPISTEGVSSPSLQNKGQSSSRLQTHSPKIETQTHPMAQPRSQSQTRPQIQKLEQQKEEDEYNSVQPPLPPYPPPPDSPSILMTNIKKEKMDNDEPHNENVDDLYQAMREAHGEAPCIKTSKAEITIKNSEQAQSLKKEPKKTVCKEFIRGNCNRPVCKYAHEIDISQLEGVYTFCWNYQNSACTYPNCRFVHASVFEQEQFFKTGILPSHTRKHLMKQGSSEGTQSSVAPVFGNPPPLFYPGLENSVAPSIAAGSNDERPPADDFKVPLPCSTSSRKREWNDIEAFSSAPRDLERTENPPITRKCDTCDTTKFRLQYNKEKVENMILSNEELKKKIALLDKKTNKLSHVLLALIKPTLQTRSGPSVVAGTEKDKVTLEQLSSFSSTNQVFNSNSTWMTLMSKLLYANSGDQNAPENSREA